jgi:DNA (cytosine-5)-methyltransferase 1
MTLTLMDWFCGAGGSSQGAHAVPGVQVTRAANHWQRAIESHASNFPDADHYRGDIREAPVDPWDQMPRWRGEFRKLRYLGRKIAMNSMHADPRSLHQAPQSRDRWYWAYWHESLGRQPDWDKWLRPRAWCGTCGTWVQAVQVFKRPGQDMGRYRQQYVYRCPNVTCRNQIVEPSVLPAAVAIDWSIPGQRIGDKPVKEFFEDKAKTKSLGFHPLAPKTLARVEAGLKKFARPLVVPAGGTWRNGATSVGEPMPTRTTRENDGLAIPPLLVPVEGREEKRAGSANDPLRTQTARNETGLAWLPFMVKLRGGGDQGRALSAFDALGTVSADGNHHGVVTPPHLPTAFPALLMRNNTPRGNPGQLCTPVDEPARTLTSAGHQSLVTWEHLLVPYYGNSTARPVSEPIGTLSTRDRYALVRGDVNINDVLFRMLEPHEIGRAMSFADSYIVLGNKRERVRQYGNAVTPNVAEVILCALVEVITGEDIDRYAPEAAAA